MIAGSFSALPPWSLLAPRLEPSTVSAVSLFFSASFCLSLSCSSSLSLALAFSSQPLTRRWRCHDLVSYCQGEGGFLGQNVP